MRLPSIDELVGHASAAFRRFPFTIGAGLASAFLAIALVEDFDDVFGLFTRSDGAVELLVAATLALPLFFAVRLAEERRVLSGTLAALARVAGVVGLGAFVWFWPEWSEKLQFLHYVQLSLGLHLLAAVLPFARRGELNGFWQYNRALFLRFLIGALYSVVLFGGLAIALVAIDNLFGVDVRGEFYGDLLAVIGFGFQTWFFTAGVPESLDALEQLDDYPRGLKLFAQYVLIPLVSVYLLILTAYLVRVVVTTEWPSGWIGWLVSCVSVAGILSILLTHPIRHREENRWIVGYGRWFWLIMIPSIGMLLVAVWKRIDQYGVTEPRYFLLLLTLWLAGMAVLYGIVRSQNIKLLPATLGVLAFLTLAGPWGPYAVSRSSQLSRLEGLLERNGLLEDGRATPRLTAAEAANEAVGGIRGALVSGDTVSVEDRRQIGAALTYLFTHHGADPLVDLLGPELAVTDSLGGTDPVRDWIARDRAAEVMAALDLDFVDARTGFDPGGYFNFRVETGSAVDVTGYRYVFDGGPNIPARIGERELTFELEGGRRMLVKSEGVTILVLPLEDLAARAIEHANLPASGPGDVVPREIMRVEASAPGIEAVFFPNWLSGRRVEGQIEVNSAQGLWLVNLDEAGLAAPPDTAATPPR